MAHIKLLIMGLPGAGKTTLAKRIAPMFGAVHFDADEVRPRLWPELGFSRADRLMNASRIGRLCDMVNSSGFPAVASFVCPTKYTRQVFNATHTVWVDRIEEGRFADTNAMFEPPLEVHPFLQLKHGTVDQWVDQVRIFFAMQREAA